VDQLLTGIRSVRSGDATSEIEIAIRPVSELLNVTGIDSVGPVPEEVRYLLGRDQR
jgi:hypothetical protein